MLRAAKVSIFFCEKQFVFEWVRVSFSRFLCVNGKRWNCFLVQSSESLLQVYNIQYMHTTALAAYSMTRVVFFLPLPPAVAIFWCCCYCFYFFLLMPLLLLLIGFLFILVFSSLSLSLSIPIHTKTFVTTVDLWFTITLENCNRRIYSAHECTHLYTNKA